MLNEAQIKKSIDVWNYYVAHKIEKEQIDNQRNSVIQNAREIIKRFLEKKISIEDFKTEIDGFNKKNSLWGFKGINGQMFFNMLFNASSGAGLVDKLDEILKTTIPLPSDIHESKSKVSLIVNFSNSLSNYVSEKRSAPRTGSALFFISYFWQIQSPLSWPVYYKSMVDVFQDLGLWYPKGDYSKDYEEFYQVNFELKDIFKKEANNEINLWSVEHAFYTWAEKDDEIISNPLHEEKKDFIDKTELPTSFIPPVVSILPLLASRDQEIENLCINSGISIEKAFEEKIAILFKMLNYKVESLGQGYGRVPDGIAICSEYHYAIIYDAKVRKDGYSIGTDDRAIKEYIFHESERMKRQGIKNVYFAIISSFSKVTSMLLLEI